MTDDVVDDMVAVLPPLLQTLESLGFVSRYLNPLDFGAVIEAAGTPDRELRAARPRLESWPETFADVRTVLAASCDAALSAFDGLREVAGHEEGIRAAYRPLRYVPRALEALYPLAPIFEPVSRWFLEPARRDDHELVARLRAGALRDDGPKVGVRHAKARGSMSRETASRSP